MTATEAQPRIPLSRREQFRTALELLRDLIQRAEQCERVCHDELEGFQDEDLNVLWTRHAIEILNRDVERIAQDAIDCGLLDTAGEIAVNFTLAEPAQATP
jgi:hypothetical protein